MLWYKKSPSLLEQLRQDLEKKYQDLRILIEKNVVCLRGGFPIIHDGIELDRFQIEVKIPHDFPKSIPVVKELGGRVPLNNPLWHANADGTLCVIVPEEWLINPQSNSISAFLDGPLRNFLISHALAEAGQKRPMGERSHGTQGLWEAYGEMVGCVEQVIIERYLKYLSKGNIKGHWDCPCGSGKKLRNCHRLKVVELQNIIPPSVAQSALKRLKLK
ncbi:MAG: SEC-C metal-binding domain-containing protein [Candidatus Paceibacterota bacterium]|jgi:hypothetical protein